MKLVDKIRAHPRVESLEDERCYGNGWWVYLKAGWCMGLTGDAHCFSEETLSHVWQTLKLTAPCECDDCRSGTTWKGERAA